MDEHFLHLVQGALREGREGAHLLDLVTEELDSKRIAAARRENVEEPAANGELTALFRPLDTLVTCVGEVERDFLQASPATDAQPNRLWPELRRRHSLAESRGRDVDEPPGGQHLQRPRPLADQVGGRRQSRVPTNAATGQEGDPALAHEPARGFGEIACALVVGNEHGKRPIEPFVEGADQQRQRRLGYAHTGRKRGGQAREALVTCELAYEGVKNWTVHGFSGTFVPQAQCSPRLLLPQPGGISSLVFPSRC